MEDLLKRNPEARLRVLVVWEPILPMDWSSPCRMVKARISDPGVVQFWDKQHFVSEELSKQLPAGKEPGCCRHDGALWTLSPSTLRTTNGVKARQFSLAARLSKPKMELPHNCPNISSQLVPNLGRVV